MHQRAQRKKRRLRRKCRRKAPPVPRSMHQQAQRKKRRSRRKRQLTVLPAHLLVSIHQRAPHLLRLPPSVCRSILPILPILPTPALNKVIRAMLTMPEKCLLTPIQRNLYIAQELKHVGLRPALLVRCGTAAFHPLEVATIQTRQLNVSDLSLIPVQQVMETSIPTTVEQLPLLDRVDCAKQINEALDLLVHAMKHATARYINNNSYM
mmetsp:Transcript_30126/g.65212  ORF Transcript_30126/g.65212 Transcript_30126/m.65212 type:complete len:208 (-) Transcript_30126:39-662(-)